jgi:flagellar biosynthesis/type III secretory pathway chaperone
VNYLKLIKLLEEEAAKQQDLLTLLVKERTAIAKLNQDELDEIVRKKGIVLSAIDKIAQARNTLLEPLKEQREDLKLSHLIPLCPTNGEKARLTKTISDLRKLSGEIQRFNSENGKLTSQVLGVVSSAISIISSAPEESAPRYTEQGKLPNLSEPGDLATRRGISREA